jgi:hypothetical protein
VNIKRDGSEARKAPGATPVVQLEPRVAIVVQDSPQNRPSASIINRRSSGSGTRLCTGQTAKGLFALLR